MKSKIPFTKSMHQSRLPLGIPVAKGFHFALLFLPDGLYRFGKNPKVARWHPLFPIEKHNPLLDPNRFLWNIHQ